MFVHGVEQREEGKPDCEVQNHTDDSGGNGGECRQAAEGSRRCSMKGAPRKIHKNDGMKVTHVAMTAPTKESGSSRQRCSRASTTTFAAKLSVPPDSRARALWSLRVDSVRTER